MIAWTPAGWPAGLHAYTTPSRNLPVPVSLTKPNHLRAPKGADIIYSTGFNKRPPVPQFTTTESDNA